jgi:hypothetical protein
VPGGGHDDVDESAPNTAGITPMALSSDLSIVIVRESGRSSKRHPFRHICDDSGYWMPRFRGA